MSGVRIVAARENYDIRTAEDKNLSFDSNLFLPKIFRVKRSASTASVAHGLNYPPRTMFFREVKSSPLTVAHSLAPLLQPTTPSSVDDTNLNFQKLSYYSDFEVTPYSISTDSAAIALCMLDPLGTPSTAQSPIDTNLPVIRAGTDGTEADYNNKLHSYYDTLKVHSSGTITLNASSWTPNAGDEYDVQTATYTHGLGYIPVFAPFIPFQTSLEVYYQWYWAWHKRHQWATAREYVIDDYVTDAFGTPTYKCIKYHTSSSATEPGVGASWATYWEAYTSIGIPTTIDLNSLEDIKYVYGGATVFDDEVIEVYVTTTQLVVKLHRMYGGFSYNTFPARTITLNYTVFYNKLNEEFNLLE
jgi:hypothetical protein